MKRLIRGMPGLLLGSLIFSTSAIEIAVAPVVDQSGLPPLGADLRTNPTNPYRANARAVEVGQSAFSQSCARCHGVDANPAGAPAPDLRQLNRYCRRIGDSELQAACMADNDAYFNKTVASGKTIVGVMHMPPWKGVLNQELVWAIQAFIESRVGQ
jgi:mono/diheme cytochrome c family protein